MYLLFYISSLAVIATSCFILGFYILSMDRHSRINRLFFINSMFLNAVILFTILIQLADEPHTVKSIQSFYNIVLISFLLMFLYFIVLFTGYRLNGIVIALLGLSSVAVFIIFLLKGQHLLWVTRQNGVWVYDLFNNFFWFCLYSPLLCGIVFLMLAALFRFYRNASSHKEKNQARVMVVAIIISFCGGFIFLMFLPVFNILHSPLLTPYFFAMLLYGVFFAMVKYRLMVFRIEDIAREALSYIQDMILILDTDKRILDVNNNLTASLSAERHDLRGRIITDLIEPEKDFESALDAFIAGGIDPMLCRIVYKNKAERIVTDSVVSKVYDRFGDFSAVLIVSRENRGITQFQRYFRLTDREMEIVLLTISGVANTAIAETLSITKRTVETHQNNIYNKAGIGNKMELFRVAGEFGIRPL